ncbi:TPA: CDP-glycerol glycerophosphotransferase family protein, partial [Legionella pneumophila]
MNTILIFIQSETQFNELKRIPPILDKNKYKVLFCFDISNETIKHKLQNFCTEQQWTYVSLKSNLPCELIENGNITLAQNNLSTLKKNIRQYLPKLIPKTGYYWQRANSELNSFWTIHDTNNENLELLEILFSKYKVNLILVGED